MKLVKISNDGQVVTTSRALSKLLGVEHERLVDSLSDLSCSTQFAHKNFSFFETDGDLVYELTKDGAMLFLAAIGASEAEEIEVLITHFNYLSDLLAKRDELDRLLSQA
ncbi:MAG: hypothetical protein ACRCWB_11705 [Enterovibrio sp.]